MKSINNSPTPSVWKPLKWLIPLISLTLLIVFTWTHSNANNNLVQTVNRQLEISAFETPYIYVYLHLFAFLPVFLLSFDKKVAYYKKWCFLFPALLISAIFFWTWDIWKTAAGVWGFNPQYYLFKVINLPIEEWFFFFTFPWASVFIYECLNAYFPKNTFFRRIEYPLSIIIFLMILGIGLWHWEKAYTFTVCIIVAGLLLWQLLFGRLNFRPQFYRSFLVGLIPFILVNGVLTGATTSQPVVMYNPNEYLGIRLVTIPIEDMIYNFSLLWSVTLLYEHFQNRNSKKLK